MAKALIAALFATLLVASLAADVGFSAPGRSLLQFNCERGKKLANMGNACDALCKCAIGKNKELAKREGECKEACGKCQNDMKNQDCGKKSGVPDSCNPQGVKEINECVNQAAGRRLFF